MENPKVTFRHLNSLAERRLVFPLYHQLNPRMEESMFHERMEFMMTEPNYRLLGVYLDNELVGISGYWISHKLYSGKYLEPDNVVVHRHVLLDDRGGLEIGDGVSISDYANIYSHTHSIVEQKDVTNTITRLDAGVRITYHATVLAGVHVNEQAMVGAMAVATKDVRPYHVNVGIPAKSITVKPNAPAPAHVLPSAGRARRDTP